MSYWEECIREALSELDIKSTENQTKELIEWVEGAHECYGQFTGLDVAHSNWESDESKELKALKSENCKRDLWLDSTNPCRRCNTTGWVGSPGREYPCNWCDGKGRIK